jgi:hypothetical protein
VLIIILEVHADPQSFKSIGFILTWRMSYMILKYQILESLLRALIVACLKTQRSHLTFDFGPWQRRYNFFYSLSPVGVLPARWTRMREKLVPAVQLLKFRRCNTVLPLPSYWPTEFDSVGLRSRYSDFASAKTVRYTGVNGLSRCQRVSVWGFWV